MKIPLIITQEGLTALLDAEAGTTNAVAIVEIGLSDTPFVMAPTLTDLPGEFKRLPIVAGQSAAENIIHLVAEDGSDEAYDVTGLGLFTDNGVLFGVFSHAAEEGVLFGKSSSSAFLFAVDITFQSGVAAAIDFGDANFGYPPATRETKGVAYLATDADIAAGVDDEKIVTPKQLASGFIRLSQKGVANGVATLDATGRVPPAQLPALDSIDTFEVDSEAEMLALPAGPGDFAMRTDLELTYVLRAAPATDVGNWAEFLSPGAPVRSVNGKIGNVVLGAADVGAAPAVRAVNSGGLVQGGGDLTDDRTLTVLIASAAETLAGLINDKAVTPASLALLIASLAGKVGSARKVDTAGLATGGGDLSIDRTITVLKASGADVDAGTDDTKALTALALWGTLRSISATGYVRIPGTPLILQWGNSSISSGNKVVTFPIAFPSTCWHVFTTYYGDPDDGDESDEELFVKLRAATSFTADVNGDWRTFSFGFLAIGI